MEESECKKVDIMGTGNRYLMKKVMKVPPSVHKRKEMEKNKLPDEFFTVEAQLQMIDGLYKNNTEIANYDLIKSQILKKLQGYKSQDSIKKLYNAKKFITYEGILKELYESQMLCHYCKQPMFLLYELVREQKQWTLDRIDNYQGHNEDNIVASCLECNLKRRRTSKDAFTFTKQLLIVREE